METPLPIRTGIVLRSSNDARGSSDIFSASGHAAFACAGFAVLFAMRSDIRRALAQTSQKNVFQAVSRALQQRRLLDSNPQGEAQSCRTCNARGGLEVRALEP